MSLKRPDPVPSRCIPEHHLPVSARTDDFAVLEADGIHRTLVTSKRGGEVQRLPVPDADEAVFRAMFGRKIVSRD